MYIIGFNIKVIGISYVVEFLDFELMCNKKRDKSKDFKISIQTHSSLIDYILNIKLSQQAVMVI